MENEPFEDVFHIENWDFLLLCLIVGGYFILFSSEVHGGWHRLPTSNLHLALFTKVASVAFGIANSCDELAKSRDSGDSG